MTFLAAPARAGKPSNVKSAAAKGAVKTVLRGRASWYGREFQGRRTTNGERFNRFKYTCAHRTLPFGTRLRVTNPRTGKAVVVRVSDRGPFRHQRILDLAEVAARPLDIVRLGAITIVAEVVPEATPLGPTDAPDDLAQLQAADPEPEAAFATYTIPAEDEPAAAATASKPTPSPAVAAPAKTGTLIVPVASTFIVQAGTFADPANAQAMLARIESLDDKLDVNLSQETIDGRVLNRVLVGSFASRPEAEALRKRLRVYGVGGLVREIPGT
ncbi:septal ring lytic transglycosylase RlpA family protein [Hymenobacter saemangeumensis]|uniref:septal ring lytic transglycosylase RlpA family protein n=1 Tax=Hymenobacter saemangeumensis TaxID=1084522 RepID=UPI0031EA27FD